MSHTDLIGKTFGRLTVLATRVVKEEDYRVVLTCLCSCGTTKDVRRESVKSGDVKSCGCLARECAQKQTIHGETKTRLFILWGSMKQRCYDKNHKSYKDYGGRGIKVCDQWLDNFVAFRDWALSAGYAKGLQIDRYPNNDGNYEPGNCRWTTSKLNCRRRRNSHMLTAFGETKTLVEWTEDKRCRVPYGTLHGRVVKNGYDPERALTEPLFSRRKKS